MKTLVLACLGILAFSIPAEAQPSTRGYAIESQRVLQQSRRLNPTMSAQRYMRTVYQPTEAEIIADETRRTREEMEQFRQMECQRIQMEQQREFYCQQRAAQQRAIDSTNRTARGR